jgi:serine/threonine-protein kinase RsbW
MPEFLRLVRVTAAGLGSRLGFSYDQVEDLRLAIDELCFGLTGASGRPGTVQVRFLLHGDALEVTADGIFEDSLEIPPESAWSKVILAALVDAHDFGSGPNGPRISLIKHRGPLPSPSPPQATTDAAP